MLNLIHDFDYDDYGYDCGYVGCVDYVGFRGSVQLQGSLINGIESRLTEVEERLSDLNARGSEEHDNLANERDLNRFILSGRYKLFS